MPPFNQITSLSNLCTEWVWRWLYYCLNHEAAPQNRFKQRQYVVATLNASVRQQLLNHVCKVHMYQVDCSSKCFLIEMLGDKSTQCIDMTQTGEYYVDEIFQLYRTLTFGLILNVTKLGIVCNVRCRNDRRHIPDVNVTFYRVFNQMHHLRWLTLSGLADLTIMGILGNNCLRLEYLDISYSSYVTDDGIARLILRDPAVINGRTAEQISRMDLDTTELCNSLSYLCISGTAVSMLGAVVIMKFLPKLRSLGSQIDCGSICYVIELLQQDDGIRKFQLYEMSEFLMTAERASLLCETCPNVSKFTTCLRSMDALHILHPLQSLTIDDVRGDPWDIYDYLQTRGSTLKELILTNNINSPLDLSWIMELTPNLEKFQSNIMISEGYEIPEWKNLRVAGVTVSSSKVLLSLLTHAPALKELSIVFSPQPYSETADCLNDDLFIYIALSDGLKHLEKLKIKECALSSRGIDCLLIHCPELWYFAYLIFWHNISPDDIERFKSEAAKNNWRLKFVMREDWEGGVMDRRN
ncbi:uncharacterized protein [Macrobrachium rosenbergii]|uniref:uncharacterized protein isoform X1 n=1 Tax=Macrobrachium rosenbergii TaxID=79674 RepID=UPI0034D72285